MGKHSYLMESDREAERLLTKSDADSTEQQLALTGINDVPKGGVVADVGCGIGIVATGMTRLLSQTNPTASLLLIDGSQERLEVAQQRCAEAGKLATKKILTPVETIALPDEHCDFMFSRFLFEYLKDPIVAFHEIVRVTKPGGKIIIGDLDNNSLVHYPIEPKLESQLLELTQTLAKLSLFDPFAGRKLFSYFNSCGMREVKVHLIAHHLFYGPLPERDYINWKMKLQQLVQLQEKGALKLSFNLSLFGESFLKFLTEPTRFSYTPLILVEGRKPK